MSKWFVEDSWNGYRPHVESIYDSQFEYFDVTEIEYSGDDEILVRTIEHINQNEFVTIYHGQYTLMEVDNGEMRIVASSHDVMEVIEPDYHIYNEDLSAFLRQFRADYMVALNEGYFSYIESYLSESGRAYSGLRDYVQSISGQGHYFDFQVFDVQSIEKLGSNQYRVKTYEEFVFTSNEGKQTAYQKEKEYLVQALSETTFSILQIEDLHTVREEIIVRTIDNVSSWQVEDFIERYYRDFIYAFNGAGFSYVEEYFIQGNSEYNATVNYIANANEKEMHVQNQFLRVDGIWEHDDTRLLVEVEVVDAYSYRDGSGDEKRVSVDYLIHVSEYGTMRIEEIPRLDILEEYRYDAVENEGE
nr:hypothetical protein [Halalkalibacter wakoensis]